MAAPKSLRRVALWSCIVSVVALATCVGVRGEGDGPTCVTGCAACTGPTTSNCTTCAAGYGRLPFVPDQSCETYSELAAITYGIGSIAYAKNDAGEGKLLACGWYGGGGNSNTDGRCQLVDAASGVVTVTTSMSGYGPDCVLTSTAPASGTIIRAGGWGASTVVYDTVEAYDVNTGEWTPRASMPIGVVQAASAVDGTKLFAFGGIAGTHNSNAEAYTQIYDAALDSWSAGAAMPEATALGRAVNLGDGRIMVVGGGTYPATQRSTRVRIYDIADDSWSSGPDLPYVTNAAGLHRWHGCTYMLGGVTGVSGTFPAQRLCDCDDAWTAWTTAPPADERIHHAWDFTSTASVNGDMMWTIANTLLDLGRANSFVWALLFALPSEEPFECATPGAACAFHGSELECVECDPACASCTASTAADCIRIDASTADCAASFYSSVDAGSGAITCVACPSAPCEAGTFESQPCSSDGARVCASCDVCDAGSEFESSPCTPTTDRVCTSCSSASCTANHFLSVACGGTADNLCAPCSSCSASGFSVVAACTATSDTVCATCEESCSDGTWAVAECEGSEGTGVACTSCRGPCDPSTQYESAACSPTTNRQCSLCTEEPCPTGSFKSAECTSTADRTCDACSSCSDSEHVAQECSATSDTTCAPCAPSCDPADGSGEFASLLCPDGSSVVCSPCGNCAPGFYAAAACSAVADVACAPCHPSCSACTPPGGSSACSACATQYYSEFEVLRRPGGPVCTPIVRPNEVEFVELYLDMDPTPYLGETSTAHVELAALNASLPEEVALAIGLPPFPPRITVHRVFASTKVSGAAVVQLAVYPAEGHDRGSKPSAVAVARAIAAFVSVRLPALVAAAEATFFLAMTRTDQPVDVASQLCQGGRLALPSGSCSGAVDVADADDSGDAATTVVMLILACVWVATLAALLVSTKIEGVAERLRIWEPDASAVLVVSSLLAVTDFVTDVANIFEMWATGEAFLRTITIVAGVSLALSMVANVGVFCVRIYPLLEQDYKDDFGAVAGIALLAALGGIGTVGIMSSRFLGLEALSAKLSDPISGKTMTTNEAAALLTANSLLGVVIEDVVQIVLQVIVVSSDDVDVPSMTKWALVFGGITALWSILKAVFASLSRKEATQSTTNPARGSRV